MNKSLLLLAAAAMTLAACSNSDELTGNAGNGTDASSAPTAVQFSTYLAGGQTRAGSGGTVGAQTTSTLQTQGFGVFAYNTKTNTWADASSTSTPDFMYNQKVTYNNNVWEYTPIKYWPNDFSDGNVDDQQGTNGEENNATGSEKGSMLSFFAYAPYVDAMGYTTDALTSNPLKHSSDNDAIKTKDNDGSAAATEGIIGMTFNTTKGAPYVRYHLASTDIENAVDLLWGKKLKDAYALADGTTQDMSKKEYNTDLTKQAANEKVGFSFKHALAKLGGNTSNITNTTVKDENNGKVKIVLDIDNGTYDASTAITGGTKGTETLVTVNSITIQDVKSYLDGGGTKYTTVTSNYKYRKSGWFNLATGEWDAATTDDYVTSDKVNKYSTKITPDGDGTTAEKLTMNSDIAEPTLASGSTLTYNANDKKWQIKPESGEATDVTATGVTTSAKSVYATPSSNGGNSDPGILMIPDDATAQPFVVTVDYTVRTGDSHLSKGYSEAKQVITNMVSIPAGSLEANKVYTLLIHLGLTSVKFEAVVADWTDATGTESTETGSDNPNKSDQNNKDIYLPSNTLAATVITDAKADMEAGATSATYDLSNLPEGAKIDDTSVSVKKGDDNVADATVTLGDISNGKAPVTVDGLSANKSTTDTVTYTVKFNVLNSQGTTLQKVTLTINQAAKTA